MRRIFINISDPVYKVTVVDKEISLEIWQATQVCAVCPVFNAWQSRGPFYKAQCDSLNHVSDIPGSTSLNKQISNHDLCKHTRGQKYFMYVIKQTNILQSCFDSTNITCSQQYSSRSDRLHHSDSTAVLKMMFSQIKL